MPDLDVPDIELKVPDEIDLEVKTDDAPANKAE